MALRNMRSTESKSAAPSAISADSGTTGFGTLVDMLRRRAEPDTPVRPAPGQERSAGGMPVDRQRIEDWLVAQIASMQRINPEQVDVDESFIANGLSSRSSVALIGDLAKVLGVTLSETLTWEYPTIAALAEQVAGIGASPHDD